MKPKFIIVSLRQTAGGPIVLHKLAALLCARGYDARVFLMHWTKEQVYRHPVRFWLEQFFYFYIYDTLKIIKAYLTPMNKLPHKLYCYRKPPVKGVKRKVFPFFNKRNTIVVYPEIVWGNFLHAKNVVRYLLNKNHYGNEARGKNDLVIAFRDFFNDASINPSCRIVTLNNFDGQLYRRTNFSERKGTCYILRKGKNRKDLPTQFNGPVIDLLTDEEKVRVFNECEWCIDYDTQTYYATIALVCGCKVVKVPAPGKTRADYLGKNENGYGFAFGYSEQELDFAERTKDKVFERIAGIDTRNEENIDKFINYCAEHFTQFEFS